jgi:hypothetical protein
MTRYQYDDPVSVDFSHPWVRQRLEQLEGHFSDFLTSKEGRLYVIFGGRLAGKTSLLQIIQQFPPKPGEKSLSVFIDLAVAGVISSSKDFFKLLFEEIRRQLRICYIDPEEAARLFQDDSSALPDFRRAFYYIAQPLDSKVHGARLLLLLDNADKVAQAPYSPELFTNLIRLFSDSTYIQHVTSQLDLVMAGGVSLYNQLLAARFPRKLRNWYNMDVLPPDAAQALISDLPAIRKQPDLIMKIMRYTGGQPYLLQCFMAQLETMTSLNQSLTSDAITQVVAACLETRSEIGRPFYEWLQGIKQQGARAIYTALATGETMSWPQIKAIIQERGLSDTALLLDPVAVDCALDTLLFHGLVRYDEVEGTGNYTATCELFRQWFVENVISPEERSKITMSQQEWAMSILTAAVPMLYDILKWLRKERERDREETIQSTTPAEASVAPPETPPRQSIGTAEAMLTVLKEVDLAAERAAIDRLKSLGRQMESRRENINFYEEELAEMPIGRERLNLRKGFGRERAEVERITHEMQEILERLSGCQVITAG